MQDLFRSFWFSILLTVSALAFVFVQFGLVACATAGLLVILEITLSFDNAVVNARILAKMSPVWQKRFLTWGIAIAVFGTRIVLPILIVSVAVWLSPLVVAGIAFFDPKHYGELLEHASPAIHSFGGVFLLLVALKYFLDVGKKVHWISSIERHLSVWGKLEAIEVILALMAVLGVSFLVSPEIQLSVLIAGVAGVILFMLMQTVMAAFAIEAVEVASKSAALFVYLEVLDSAFSLDGVVGAFALTSAIPIIAVGLGVGAYFVRSLTMYFVRKQTLDSLLFLEHGAHWAIFGLSASMFASLLTEVPEVVTGTVGIAFICAAYYSSLRAQTKAVSPL